MRGKLLSDWCKTCSVYFCIGLQWSYVCWTSVTRLLAVGSPLVEPLAGSWTGGDGCQDKKLHFEIYVRVTSSFWHQSQSNQPKSGSHWKMMNEDNVSSKLLWNHHMTQLSVLAWGQKAPATSLWPTDKFARCLILQDLPSNLPLLIQLFEANARCQRMMANVPMSHFQFLRPMSAPPGLQYHNMQIGVDAVAPEEL